MLSRVELVTAGDQCNLNSLSQANSVVIAARAKMCFLFLRECHASSRLIASLTANKDRKNLDCSGSMAMMRSESRDAKRVWQ